MSASPSALTSWHDDWRGLRVAVLGLGVTGFSVADTLAELGASVLVIAGAHDDDRERILEVLGVPVVVRTPLDVVPDELAAFEPELVVASPGFAPHHPLMRWAADRELPIWGDIELAWRLRDKTGRVAEWLCVTGTNGKTTTTQLTAHMLHTAGMRAVPCGNIGTPILDAIRDPQGYDVLVVELSSYQLHSITSVAPTSSVVLNLADDHLDWHGSAEAYRLAKGRVYEHTRIACVYNLADDATRRLVEDAEVQEGCRAIGFGLGTPGPSDLGVVDGVLIDRAFLEERRTSALELATVEELRAVGLGAGHLVQNTLAAAALARSIGVAPEHIHDALATFAVDRHRNELVGERDGVAWVDDSKATNAHAANASLHAYPSVVWVVGGLLKGVDLSPLVAKHATRLRAAVVIGADRAAVGAAFAQHAPDVPVHLIDVTDTDDVMPRVIACAEAIAQPGDTVLLAPAAASMDQFISYSDRGQRFAAAVRSAWEAESHDRDSAPEITRIDDANRNAGHDPDGPNDAADH
ncbi:UDP-N-acetylmuramoylalanine--D-glutamate ligase [Pseudoclavibacter endophyticus]|nr:UDP-N-acetylmuramoyl-L-alanine--D-glutamate ligase [Pseudoclavibacter endophyticus]GGA55812.1 UDP-N-acetylmuramoylalanine--D-glutamate ligase [Pseudoclavibacter endophyticus]